MTFNYREKAKKPTSQSRRNSDATQMSREAAQGEGSEQGGGGSEFCDSDGEGEGEGEGKSKSMVLKAHDLKVRQIERENV